jgi:hypothetical protein
MTAGVFGTGTLTTQGTSTLEFSAANGNFVLDQGRRWVNEGTINLNGDDRILFGFGSCCTVQTATLLNSSGATINLNTTAPAPITTNNWMTPLLSNAGTINKNAAGTQLLAPATSSWGGAFNHSGSVNVNAGRLQIQGGGTDTGTYTTAASAELEFTFGSRTMSAASVPTGGAPLLVTGAALTINAPGALTLPATTVNTGSLTVATGGNFSVPSLTVTNANVGVTTTGSITASSLSKSGTGTLTLSATGNVAVPALTLTGGSLTMSSTFGSVAVPTALTATNSTLTLNAPSALALGSLTLDNSSLVGTASVTVSGAFNAQGATAAVLGTGTFTTQGTSTLEFSTASGSFVLDQGRRWINEGTVNLNGDDRIAFGFGNCCTVQTPTLINVSGATINLNTTAASPFVSNNWVSPQFTNAGTINKNAAGTQLLAAGSPSWGGTFNHSGTVNINAGRLQIAGNGSDTGVYTAASGAEVEFVYGARTMSPASIPTGGTPLLVSGAALTITAPDALALPAVAISASTGGTLNVTTGGDLSMPSLAVPTSNVSLTAGGNLNLGSFTKAVEIYETLGRMFFDIDIDTASI